MPEKVNGVTVHSNLVRRRAPYSKVKSGSKARRARHNRLLPFYDRPILPIIRQVWSQSLT